MTGAGWWVALEGGEGSGKSTQARRLADTLGAVLTREPGGTAIGARIRAILLDPAGEVDERAEALLMAADRAQHASEVVLPALGAGRSVVSDRSVWSSLAYQGYGRGLDLAEIRRVSDWALRGRWPDLAVLVDVSPAVAARRLRAAGRVPDRLEAAGESFHRRVRDGFAALAAAEPERWVRVDGEAGPDVVASAVLAAVRGRLGSA
ncbi:MAG TPA: dTMP kinase [Acidimicrobiales bacterium]